VVYKGGKRVFVFIQEHFAPQSIVITCKDIYSDELRCEIKHSIAQYLSGRSYADVSLDELHKNLKQYFKLIEKVSWNWCSWGESELVVEGVKPLFIVNDMFVLGEKRRLFPTVFFTDISLDSLKSVSLNFSLCGIKIPRSVHNFLKKVPKDYWDKYKISYNSCEEIVLEHKESSLPSVFVVNENVVFDKEKVKRAELLYDDVLRRKKVTRLNRSKVVYDLRFDNRIYAKITRRT
jgi:hypothetical protein